ncbi:cytochrome P450 3A41-like [Centruroides sculpturatus]|uniref:cytochrome P450 3A41-like n=2 Tax=Centruroides sculpturatus TaxID=218467 RepID=UPI000C6E4CC5|nr:cytochrome P450 3A41-like [Centruroides sculpturatus]
MYFNALLLLSIVVCIIFSWIRWRKGKMNLFQRYGIPGPKPNFITGNMNEFHEKRNKCIDEWLQQYGNIFGFFFGAKPYLVCNDLELIKILQVKEFKNFANKDLVLPDSGIPHKLYTHFMELQHDEKWKNTRSILSTSFSSGKIKMMSTLMEDPINIFLKKIEKLNGKPFDILEYFKKLTFDVICSSAFGIKTDVQNNETSKFIQSAHTIFEVDSTDILCTISICFPEFEPIPMYLRQFKDAIKNMLNLPAVSVVFDTCKQIINSRKKSEYHPPDLLQTMIDAEGDSEYEAKKLSVDEVSANATIFIVASYDNTSNTLGWSTYYLAHHPEAQDKALQEINDNIKNHEAIQYTDLVKLKYLDQVLSETLRLTPLPIVAINRICKEDFRYKDVTIPKGAVVLVPVPILQKDSNYWKDPEKFDPERFSPKNHIDPFIYQPFGAGPRICIGVRLAQTIMKLILANLIRSFKLEPHGDSELELEHTLFMTRPKNGIMMRAIPYSNAAS